MLPASLSKEKFIDFAAGDMDSKLGYRYVTPIDTTALPVHQLQLLMSINAKLATGRLIMATAVGGEDTAVHQYALYLVKEAEMDLMSIANGQVDLVAVEVDEDGNTLPGIDNPTIADPFARTPTAWNPDSVSAQTEFEKSFFTDEPKRLWDPATNIETNGEVSDVR